MFTMFARTSTGLPADPQYPSELSDLGFEVTEGGEFRDKDGRHFEFFHTDNERANELRKESMHIGARKVVHDALSTMGVKPVFVKRHKVYKTKPAGGHVTLLTTELEPLKQKKDVIIIVGEHTQDAGIWAYRLLMREAGITGGSAVGMMSMLEDWGLGAVDLPGVVVLNPGQLNYSPSFDENMTQTTWLAKGKENALEASTRIDTFHNRVIGHYFPDEHVMTVFKEILPKLTREDARFYLVGISDGGEAMLTCIDRELCANPNDPIGTKLEAIALLQPSHHPSQITSPALAKFLADRGRSWVMSDTPQGTLLQVPFKPAANTSASQLAIEASMSGLSTGTSPDSPKKPKHVRHGSASSISKPVDVPARRRNTVAHDIREKYLSDVFTRYELEPPPFPFRDACFSMAPYTGPSLMNGVEGHTFRPPLSKVPSAVWSTVGDSDQGTPSPASPSSPTFLSLPSFASKLPSRKALKKKFAQQDIDRALTGRTSPDSMLDLINGLTVTDPNLEEEAVSTPTFSAGPEAENVVECVWPAVMPSVLEWFRQVRDEANVTESDGESASFQSFLTADSGGSTEEDLRSMPGSFDEMWKEVKG